MDKLKYAGETKLVNGDSGRTFSIHRNIHGTRIGQSNDYPKNHGNNKRNRYYKYIPAIISLFFAVPSHAETIGGVSATAAPVANSSGSVTNQAIQVLQGPYITNTYGGGIQCQGPTLNFTPFLTGANSWQNPYEDYYQDPVYDMRDLNEDGAPDNPGSILYKVPIRTGQKNNNNLSAGLSATLSIPLDTKLQKQCKEAAAANIAMMQQSTANKRLDFEIARLKNCGELIKSGISFHPRSPYASICSDVVVNNVTHIKQHRHTIESNDANDLGGVIGN
tara:strand:+ start:180 stop:1010 length:831 start_codon:yes stop_codon:yes gene_type:complete